MALHVAVFFFIFFFFLLNRLVRIIEGPDNQGPDNRGSTVYVLCDFDISELLSLYSTSS